MTDSPKPTRATDSEEPVLVFFDGVCAFCNGSVDFLLKRDLHRKLLFSPLQGRTARARLTPSDVNHLDSIVVLHGHNRYTKSDAVLFALTQLGGFWKLVALTARLVPLSLRNFIYKRFAGIRYALFGKLETCRLPTAAERSRFLD